MTIETKIALQGAAPLSADDERWRAVVARDADADGQFVFSVRTTGIYCRPSCPARRPLRRNVAFHATCLAAERAGYRPCRRCRPHELARDQAGRAERIAAACRTIEAADAAPSLDELARAAGLSRSHFLRVFKAHLHVTPRAYAAAVRAKRLRDRLAASGSVTAAMHSAGFVSSGRFYESAAALLGMAPRSYRRGGAGETIRFAVGECSLGAVLVAATEQGVCAILLGDDPDALARDLQDRFPRAEFVGSDGAFEQTVACIVGGIELPGSLPDLPLDIRGTAFQQRVWAALREIPCGSTTTYTDVAARIGQPEAVRAVASAVAANPLAVAIPCHRVVRRDGDLAGYRWGVERKRELLRREALLEPGLGRASAPSQAHSEAVIPS